MDYETLTFEIEKGVGVLTLNRPKKLNAVNHVMRDELTSFWRDRTQEPDLKVVVLTGSGKGFCAGLDLYDPVLTGMGTTRKPQATYEAQRSFSEMILLMRACPQPIVGAIHGVAVGAGLSFAMACDMRLATPSARFQAAYINLGLGGADMGSSWLLPRAIGAANAARYLYTGDFMAAEEAYRMGFVQQLAEPEQLLDEALVLARKIANKSPLGLRVTKEALNINAGGPSLAEAIQLEDRNQTLCITNLTAG